MSARAQDGQKSFGQACKEFLEALSFFLVQGREARERGASVPVERGWNTPDAAVAIGALLELIGVEFFDAVGRVRNDCVNATFWCLAEPLEAVGVDQERFADRV